MQDLTVTAPRELQEWTREKVDLLKRTVARGATDDELALFAHVCKRTGLDPFARQIYAVKRWNSQDGKESMALQTGIDGYRLIADRTGCYAGSSDPEYVLGVDGYPDVAKVTITKLVNGVPCAFTSSARWDEYVQKTKDGKPTHMWHKMPFLMLGKCAEALALRKAFPAELSGLYTHEEMQQVDEPKAAFIDNKTIARTKIEEIQMEGIQPVEQDGAGAQHVNVEVPSQQARDAALAWEQRQPQSAEPSHPDNAIPDPTASARYAGYAARLRQADTIAAVAALMNEALNGPEALLSQEERRSIGILKEQCMEKFRKRKEGRTS